MPISSADPSSSSVDRDHNRSSFDRSLSNTQQGFNPRTIASPERIGDSLEPPAALSQIVLEAAKRAGITTTDGRLNKTDVQIISAVIRKDPALFEAWSQLQNNTKRARRRQYDSEVTLDLDDAKRKPRRYAGMSVDLGYSDPPPAISDAELHISPAERTESRVDPAPAYQRCDLAAEILKMFDHDGDGIVTVRQVLEYIVFHARDKIRFNNIELINILKILTANEAELLRALDLRPSLLSSFNAYYADADYSYRGRLDAERNLAA